MSHLWGWSTFIIITDHLSFPVLRYLHSCSLAMSTSERSRVISRQSRSKLPGSAKEEKVEFWWKCQTSLISFCIVHIQLLKPFDRRTWRRWMTSLFLMSLTTPQEPCPWFQNLDRRQNAHIPWLLLHHHLNLSCCRRHLFPLTFFVMFAGWYLHEDHPRENLRNHLHLAYHHRQSHHQADQPIVWNLWEQWLTLSSKDLWWAQQMR